jgi:CBS domain-containing protein
VRCCHGDDEVEDVLATMRSSQVHRLPVLDANDKLSGVISFSDVVRHASLDGKIRSIGDHDLVMAYRTIKAPRTGEEVGADKAYDEMRKA